jgi:hypothetical protein
MSRISTDPVFTEFTLPSWKNLPGSITTRPDGALWFTELSVDQIARAAITIPLHEFNGDGTSDVALGDTSGNASVWLMNGAGQFSQIAGECCGNAGAESRSSRIGPVTPEGKQTGERQCGKSAGCVRRGGSWKRGMVNKLTTLCTTQVSRGGPIAEVPASHDGLATARVHIVGAWSAIKIVRFKIGLQSGRRSRTDRARTPPVV